jgi:hypothetical protein
MGSLASDLVGNKYGRLNGDEINGVCRGPNESVITGPLYEVKFCSTEI